MLPMLPSHVTEKVSNVTKLTTVTNFSNNFTDVCSPSVLRSV